MTANHRRDAEPLPKKKHASKIKTAVALLLALTCLSQPTHVPATGLIPSTNSSPPALDFWQFSDTNWLSHFGNAPISYTNLINVPYLGDGNCLLLDSTNAAWLQYSTTQNGTNRLTVPTGSIILWFASSWSGTNAGGTGPGDWGRLFEIGAYTTNASYGWLSLFFNPEGTQVYFAGQTNNGSGATYLSAPVTLTTNRWHLFALTYSQTNCAFYFDGALLTNGLPLTYWPGAGVLSNGFYIGSDNTGIDQSRGMFDDFVAYDYVLDADTIAGTFWGGWVFYMNPMNKGNQITSAPSEPGPFTLESFNAITGPGYLTPISTNTAGCTTNSNIWITNFVITAMSGGSNGTATVRFQIAGGQDGILYDVFANSVLAPASSSIAWAWMGQGRHCVTYQLTNFPNTSAFMVLGTPQDSDNDGLTDAYELLVSKTDPFNADSDGSGLADWWQIVHFGHTGVDPYGDADGDGWSNLQEYLNGTNPNSFNTPPAPTGLTAYYKNGVATVNWNPSLGPVTGYIIERDIPQLGTTVYYTNSANTTLHQDNPFPVAETNLFLGTPTYEVTALYPGGNSPPAQALLYTTDTSYATAVFIRGPQGNFYLAWSGVPTNVPTVKLVKGPWDFNGTPITSTSWTLATSSFTNGICLVPPEVLPGLATFTYWFLETTNASGLAEMIFVYPYAPSRIPFFDGRQQLQENLAFIFRAPTTTSPFFFQWLDFTHWYDFYSYPTNYSYSGFYEMGTRSGIQQTPIGAYEFGPFRYNAMYRNFVCANTNDIDRYGGLANGVSEDHYGYFVDLDYYAANYRFVPPTNLVAIPPLLTTNDARWISQTFDNYWFWTDLGIDYVSPNLVISGTAQNFFGLPYSSAKLVWTNTANGWDVLTTSHNIPFVPPYDGSTFYADAAQPQLQTVSYYFTTVPAGFQDYPNLYPPLSPVPGQAGFSPTNTNPLLIASVGDPAFHVVGFAKQALVNGYSNIFGYLGQYFDKAYLIGANGTATTNETGVLSPYGDFLPTEPGPVALVTMTNWGANERGTGVVNVIKLQLDVNHDGIMDLSFGGPDNASGAKPFVFWINNDWDQNDGAAGKDVFPQLHDCTDDFIQSQRDLEDFARLWVCGIPSLPTGYQVTLSWNVSSGSPAINLFRAAETNGGTGYLSNTNIAAAQSYWQLTTTNGYYPGWRLGTVSSGQTFTFPVYFFTNSANKYLLFEGAGVGSGQLVLTITQNATNVIAQTGAWLDLHDVKDLYERMIISNHLSSVISNWSFGIQRIEYPKVLSQNENTNIIVHCHGADTLEAAWLMGADTLFKRFYWAGYRGRFASVHWPAQRFKLIPFDPGWFNRSELICYKSAPSLKNYMDQLHDRFPSYRMNVFAHSLGPAIASEALRLGAPYDTLVLASAAMSASCYDVNAPTNSTLVADDTGDFITPEWQPMGYRGIYTNFTGRVVSLFNTNDGTLKGKWLELGQRWPVKPTRPWGYDGTNSWANYIYPRSAPMYLVTDSQESRALVSRSRTLAAGMLGPIPGQTTQGVIQSAVDIRTQFGIQDSDAEHYAAYFRPIQTIWGYYDEVLGGFLIPKIQR